MDKIKINTALCELEDFYGDCFSKKDLYKSSIVSFLHNGLLTKEIFDIFFNIFLYYSYWHTISSLFGSITIDTNYKTVFEQFWEDDDSELLKKITNNFYDDLNEFIIDTSLDKVSLFETYLSERSRIQIRQGKINKKEIIYQIHEGREIFKWMKAHLKPLCLKFDKKRKYSSWTLLELYVIIAKQIIDSDYTSEFDLYIPITSVISSLDSMLIIELFEDIYGILPSKAFKCINSKRVLWKW